MNGSNDLKGIADIQLPSFEMMRDTVKGAGIAGEYESPTLGQVQSMKLTLNWHTVAKEQLLMLKQQAHRYDCRGAFQDYDSASGTYVIRQVRVVVQGPTMKVDPGRFENGASTGGSNEVEVLYIKIDIDGTTYVEIDKLNYKHVVGGIDYLASTRTALGI
jgi:hypothetical protein